MGTRHEALDLITGTRVRHVLAVMLTVGALGASTAACGADSSNPLQPWKTDPPTTEIMAVEGRPLRRGRRRLHVAASRTGGLRVTDAATLAIGRAERDVLAAHWTRAGEMEHASVVAFVDLACRLRRLGAPAELVARCIQAADQELDHARRCFALASRFAGHDVRPGRLGRLWRLPSRRSTALSRLAVESLRDGVLNEGYAAWLAAGQALLASDPEARAALERIAVDEAEHAALSADMVAWCIAAGGEPVRRAVGAVLADASFRVTPRRPTTGDAAVLTAHGLGDPDPAGAAYSRLRDLVLAAA